MIKAHVDGPDVHTELKSKDPDTTAEETIKLIRGIYQSLKNHTQAEATEYYIHLCFLLFFHRELIMQDDSLEEDDREIIISKEVRE